MLQSGLNVTMNVHLLPSITPRTSFFLVILEMHETRLYRITVESLLTNPRLNTRLRLGKQCFR